MAVRTKRTRGHWLVRGRQTQSIRTFYLVFLVLFSQADDAGSAGLRLRVPTMPSESDPGAPTVYQPVNVKVKSWKLSPEQLVIASMPWEGMDKPASQRRASFPRPDDKYDSPEDSTLHQHFGEHHPIVAHPPPFIPGDVDRSHEMLGMARRSETEGMRTVIFPPLPTVGPQMLTRDARPDTYYTNPLVKYSPGAPPVPNLRFLQLPSHHQPLASRGNQMTLKEYILDKSKSRKRDISQIGATASIPASLLELQESIYGTGNVYAREALRRQHQQERDDNEIQQAVRMSEIRDKSAVFSLQREPNDLGGRDGGNKHWKASEFIVPPVGANKGMDTPPELAVLGDQSGSNDQMVAPRRQQFTGDFDYDPAKDGKPLPVRPYAVDQPSAYQAAPLWPPAPPEPLFPLKGDSSGDAEMPQPPLPGGFSPYVARL